LQGLKQFKPKYKEIGTIQLHKNKKIAN
jgi:hypothetical protein